MKTKLFTIFIACFIITNAFSQTNLNDYKYVIVSKKFDFLKEANQYRLNELTKFLFEKQGFMALMEGENYPDDLFLDRCLALKSSVLKESGMFKTKLKIELKDCNDRVVYTSPLGESRIKEYGKAYNEALRNAFKDLSNLGYKYLPKQNNTLVAVKSTSNTNNENTQEIQQLKEEIQSLKEENVGVIAVAETKKEAIVSGIVEVTSAVLYAQEIENGFQLVDSSPKVVYRIKNTNLNNVFLVENKSAIIYKKENDWVLEFYSNNVLKQESLNIKF